MDDDKTIQDFERRMTERQQVYEELIHRAAMYRLQHELQNMEEPASLAACEPLPLTSQPGRFLRALWWRVRKGHMFIQRVMSHKQGGARYPPTHYPPVVIDMQPLLHEKEESHSTIIYQPSDSEAEKE